MRLGQIARSGRHVVLAYNDSVIGIQAISVFARKLGLNVTANANGPWGKTPIDEIRRFLS